MNEAKHSHYKKDVTGLSMIDVYRVLSLFGVTDPCIQHACKKLLVTGNRGHKDAERDIQDAIDTLERWKEMRAEDNQRQSVRHPMTPNVIEPASQIDDDSPRMQAIGQNGPSAEHYSELDRLQAAADFNDNLPMYHRVKIDQLAKLTIATKNERFIERAYDLFERRGMMTFVITGVSPNQVTLEEIVIVKPA